MWIGCLSVSLFSGVWVGWGIVGWFLCSLILMGWVVWRLPRGVIPVCREGAGYAGARYGNSVGIFVAAKVYDARYAASAVWNHAFRPRPPRFCGRWAIFFALCGRSLLWHIRCTTERMQASYLAARLM